MEYYVGEEMKGRKQAFEEEILRWEEIGTKKMFGCPSYMARGKLFAFLTTDGIVITQLDQTEKEKLSQQHQAEPFQAGKKLVQGWMKVAFTEESDLGQILPYVKKSYNNALGKGKADS